MMLQTKTKCRKLLLAACSILFAAVLSLGLGLTNKSEKISANAEATTMNVLDFEQYTITDGAFDSLHLGERTLTKVDGHGNCDITDVPNPSPDLKYAVEEKDGKTALKVSNLSWYIVNLSENSLLFPSAVVGADITKIEFDVWANWSVGTTASNTNFNECGGIRLFSTDDTGVSGEGYTIPYIDQEKWVTVTITDPDTIALFLNNEGNFAGLQFGCRCSTRWGDVNNGGKGGKNGGWGSNDFAQMWIANMNVTCEEAAWKEYTFGDTVNVLDFVSNEAIKSYQYVEKSLTKVNGTTIAVSEHGTDLLADATYALEEKEGKRALKVGTITPYKVGVTKNALKFLTPVTGSDIKKIEFDVYMDGLATKPEYTFNKNGGIRLFSTDDTGAIGEGYVIPVIAQNQWVTVTINTSISFIIGLIMNVNGFLVSYFLYKKIPGSTVFRFIFFLPSIICATVTTAVYKEFIGLNGPVLWLVQKVDKIPVKIDLLYEQAYANKMVFLNMIVFQFASNMIIWGGTFARIPVSVLEAAKLDGVSWIQEITRITVPLVWPTVALQLILSVCGFFGASGDVFLLTRGQNGTMTLSCWMYLQVYDKSNDFNALSYMSAVGLMMSFVAIIVSMLVRKFASSAFNELQY